MTTDNHARINVLGLLLAIVLAAAAFFIAAFTDLRTNWPWTFCILVAVALSIPGWAIWHIIGIEFREPRPKKRTAAKIALILVFVIIVTCLIKPFVGQNPPPKPPSPDMGGPAPRVDLGRLPDLLPTQPAPPAPQAPVLPPTITAVRWTALASRRNNFTLSLLVNGTTSAERTDPEARFILLVQSEPLRRYLLPEGSVATAGGGAFFSSLHVTLPPGAWKDVRELYLYALRVTRAQETQLITQATRSFPYQTPQLSEVPTARLFPGLLCSSAYRLSLSRRRGNDVPPIEKDLTPKVVFPPPDPPPQEPCKGPDCPGRKAACVAGSPGCTPKEWAPSEEANAARQRQDKDPFEDDRAWLVDSYRRRIEHIKRHPDDAKEACRLIKDLQRHVVSKKPIGPAGGVEDDVGCRWVSGYLLALISDNIDRMNESCGTFTFTHGDISRMSACRGR